MLNIINIISTLLYSKGFSAKKLLFNIGKKQGSQVSNNIKFLLQISVSSETRELYIYKCLFIINLMLQNESKFGTLNMLTFNEKLPDK